MSKDSAAVMVYDDIHGTLLLLKRAPNISGAGYWCPPAGHVEDGEDPIAAAIREAKEETGLNIRILNLLVVHTIPHKEGNWTGFVFNGFASPMTELKLQQEEVADYHFFSRSELKQLLEEQEAGVGKLFRPEFNVENIRRFLAYESYPLEVLNGYKEKAP